MTHAVPGFIPQVAPSIDEAEIGSMVSYLRSGGWLTEFEKTRQFEAMIAAAAETKFCSVVNNGTVALVLALLAAGVGAGDEVIVPDLTMIATANAVTFASARPVLVDISPITLCLTAASIEAALTPRTRAVMLVALNGRFPTDIADIRQLCESKGLVLIEDAAQALGSRCDGKPIGGFGAIGSYSFSPHKIVTTGQGGALVTNDERLYRSILRLKDFGRDTPGSDFHPHWGLNFKFTDLQAVIGIEQMKKLDHRVARKRAIFARYRGSLESDPRITFLPTDLTQVTPWFVDVFVANPVALATALRAAGFGTRPIYPPIHTQPVYSDHLATVLPVATAMCARGLWLPSSVGLGDADIDRICACVRDHLDAT